MLCSGVSSERATRILPKLVSIRTMWRFSFFLAEADRVQKQSKAIRKMGIDPDPDPLQTSPSMGRLSSLGIDFVERLLLPLEGESEGVSLFPNRYSWRKGLTRSNWLANRQKAITTSATLTESTMESRKLG